MIPKNLLRRYMRFQLKNKCCCLDQVCSHQVLCYVTLFSTAFRSLPKRTLFQSVKVIHKKKAELLTTLSQNGFRECFKFQKAHVAYCVVSDDNFFNPLNPELNPICYLLALLGAHHFLHLSRMRVKLLTFRRLMSYIYGAPILDVSRSHTTTQHSRQDSSG